MMAILWQFYVLGWCFTTFAFVYAWGMEWGWEHVVLVVVYGAFWPATWLRIAWRVRRAKANGGT